MCVCVQDGHMPAKIFVITKKKPSYQLSVWLRAGICHVKVSETLARSTATETYLGEVNELLFLLGNRFLSSSRWIYSCKGEEPRANARASLFTCFSESMDAKAELWFSIASSAVSTTKRAPFSKWSRITSLALISQTYPGLSKATHPRLTSSDSAFRRARPWSLCAQPSDFQRGTAMRYQTDMHRSSIMIAAWNLSPSLPFTHTSIELQIPTMCY